MKPMSLCNNDSALLLLYHNQQASASILCLLFLIEIEHGDLGLLEF